ncbi:MAG: hypothetical protein PHH13_05670 [Candidatus Peribacteraceae bacterium]|nr:hypothetical protein [Candidatus Peribacteraceae bacterium]
MDATVFTFAGQAVGLGLVASAVTQVIKITESIPFLSKYKFVQTLLDAVAPGKDRNVQFCVAIIAVILNVGSIYFETGTLPAIPTIFAAFTTFLTALGTHSAVRAPAPTA